MRLFIEYVTCSLGVSQGTRRGMGAKVRNEWRPSQMSATVTNGNADEEDEVEDDMDDDSGGDPLLPLPLLPPLPLPLLPLPPLPRSNSAGEPWYDKFC